ncbi:MAG: hypothetical protein OQK24_01560 [Magnetovibrio sp.]|nr:hypothetical protein [Magnetovibrio sp.]
MNEVIASVSSAYTSIVGIVIFVVTLFVLRSIFKGSKPSNDSADDTEV